MNIEYAPDHEYWGLNDDEARAVLALNPRQLEYAYRVQKKVYQMQDAETAVKAALEDSAQDNDTEACIILSAADESVFAKIADIFDSNHDCNIEDNAQWESAVKTYIDENRPGKDGGSL